MSESRTKNALRNVKTAFVVQFINKLMAFVVRTFFIKILNSEYLGINGLFTNILTILSFAELGIGTAIIFNMYKPIAENDKEKIKSLMYLYKKAYNTIGIVVFIIGFCLIPFMNYIITDVPNIKENIIFIYLLYLFNTASSYFFTYKKSIISAHQKQSVINNIDSIFYLTKSIIEIIFLIFTKNFIVYLLIQIGGTFIENVIVSMKADKMYPYLKDKNVKALDKSESKDIFSNVKSLIIYKFGGVIMNGTDNILISVLVNVSTVGYCSNYVMIIDSVKSILSIALNGITASIGNLNVIGTRKQKEDIFYQLTFSNYLVYCFCAIAFCVLLNPFIEIWLGKDYVLNISVSCALAVSFFIEGLRNPGYTYRTTLGLFQKAKLTPYIGTISNIVFSIILCRKFGVVGIFIATSIAQILSYMWIDPYLIHKYEFHTPVMKYFKKIILYFCIFALICFITIYISSLVSFNGVIGLLLKSMIVFIVPNLINLLFFYNTVEFKSLKMKFLNPILNKIKK